LWEESLQNPTRDKAVRKIFRNEKFRQAVSHGIDRARLKAMWGNVPVIEPTGAAGVVRSSRFYNKEARTEYNYDPEKSEQLFEEIGLVDEDGDGIREFPEDSAMAGKDFTIYIEVGTDNNDGAMLSQLVARELQKLGIDAKMRQMESSLIGNLHDANHYDIAVDRGVDQTTPLVNLGSMVPIDEYSPWWHRASPEGKRELLPFEKALRDLGEELTTTVGFEKQYELMSEIQKIFTENVYLIGLLHRSRPHAVAKRFRNVHPSNYKVIVDDRQQSLPFAMWIPKDLQLEYDI
jgi:peptide/nickel transport system substrate-binding protein